MVILASNSPRRKTLLFLAGWAFQAAPAEIDERALPGEDPLAYVLRLAEAKAQAVRAQSNAPLGEGDVILAADTTVVLDGAILGKPGSPQAARRMLAVLRGRLHTVHTGLAVLPAGLGGAPALTEVCTSEVQMRSYSDQEIDDYVATGDPLDKAGAYAIQHTAFNPVAEVRGCFANVTGLPLCRAEAMLLRHGLAPGPERRLACPGLETGGCQAAAFAGELTI